MELYETKYMRFEEGESTGLTKRVVIRTVSRGALLGEIKWYGPWRQYCFFPSGIALFNVRCLNDIALFIKRLMDEKKEKGSD